MMASFVFSYSTDSTVRTIVDPVELNCIKGANNCTEACRAAVASFQETWAVVQTNFSTIPCTRSRSMVQVMNSGRCVRLRQLGSVAAGSSCYQTTL